MNKLLLSLLLISPLRVFADAPAHVNSKEFSIGGDTYKAGEDVSVAGKTQDAFLAGRSVSVKSGASGSVHAAGESIDIAGSVLGNVYAFGRDLVLKGPVFGQVTFGGQNLIIDQGASIRKGIRAAGQSLLLKGDIKGYALLFAKRVELDGTISGDVTIAAKEVVFGKNARIGGTLTYYGESPIAVPATVIAPEKVKYEKFWDKPTSFKPLLWIAFSFLVLPWLTFLLLGFFVLLLFPRLFERSKGDSLGQPLYTGLIGFGSIFGYWLVAILLLISLIGIPLGIAMMLAFPVLLLVSYLLGAYSLIFAAWQQLTGATPVGFWRRLGVLALGLTLLHLLSLLPFVGMLIGVVAVSLGLGSLVLALRPAATISRS